MIIIQRLEILASDTGSDMEKIQMELQNTINTREADLNATWVQTVSLGEGYEPINGEPDNVMLSYPLHKKVYRFMLHFRKN